MIVNDEPGQVAQLLTDMGEAGINMEDLRMEHSAGYEVGLVEIQVLPGRRDELVSVLTGLDWKVVQ